MSEDMQKLSLDQLDGVAGGNDGETSVNSGVFVSSSGTQLNIAANWNVTGSVSGSRMLNVFVTTISYSLDLVPVPGSVEMDVNGAVYLSGADGVEYRGEAVAANLLAAFSVPITAGPQIIKVTWHFRGTYNGVNLDDIVAAGMIAC